MICFKLKASADTAHNRAQAHAAKALEYANAAKSATNTRSAAAYRGLADKHNRSAMYAHVLGNVLASAATV